MALSYDDLTPADAALLSQVIPLSDELRATACTLARLGVRFRRAEPARAARWIEILEPHPFYKLGQVMFDLLEWEDFMLDGAAPAPAPDRVLAAARALAAQAGLEIGTVGLPKDLPALEAGFYLYRDTVLGLLWVALEGQARFGTVQ